MLRKKVKYSPSEEKKGEIIEEMSEDDRRLQDELNMLVEKLLSPDEQFYMPALESLRDLIRTSTTSMTNVPRPLKYLRCHYQTLKDIHSRMENKTTQKFCADIISVLAMAAGGEKDDNDERECLKYCLLGSLKDVGDWGHEYVRQLEGEVVAEWILMPIEKEAKTKAKLLPLIERIINFDMSHNAEIQSCDLLMEIDKLSFMQKHIDLNNYPRVCHYLMSCAAYVEERERVNILKVVFEYYMQFKEYPRALCVAIQLNNCKKMECIFGECHNLVMRKQLAYMIGDSKIPVQFDESADDAEDLKQIMSSSHISDNFCSLGRELGIMEPKTPDDVYKTWLEGILLRPSFSSSTSVDSAKHNLASSFVNAFVNAGFGKDKLVTGENGKNWIYRNKDHEELVRNCKTANILKFLLFMPNEDEKLFLGMMSATASLGLIHLWDVDGGLSPIDRYLYSKEDHIKAGALLALGIVNCGVKNECEPAKALLMDYVLHNSNVLRTGAILGLGLAYSGSCREDILNLLLPALSDPKSTPEVIGLTAVACSLIAVASSDHQVSSAILQVLIDSSEEQLNNTYFRFLPLALGICHLGKRNAIEALNAALEVTPDPFKSMAQTLLQICAYAGTGDVLVIQEMLHICSEHFDTEDENNEIHEKDSNATSSCHTEIKKPTLVKEGKSKPSKTKVAAKKNITKKTEKSPIKDLSTMQAVATLGVAVIAMGEEVGTDMSPRIYGHLGQYGEPAIRRAMPLGLALCSISNPQISVIEVLNKYSHDSDLDVAHNAIFSLGLVGAGSNNARLATMLRQLAQFHAKNPNHLFMVRLAQGLNHMGKGTMSLSPFHLDRQIMNNVAVAGLLITLASFLDVKNTILSKSHYLLYTLAAAMHPRWLITLDENLKSLSVSVRVGQAIDIVGKAGTPKTITGVHTHNTPVLLAVGERAELATEEYIPLTPIMEGFVILKKNTCLD